MPLNIPRPNLYSSLPTQPCPSWQVIEGQILVGGWSAYLCALKIVYDWCQTLTVQLNELQQATGARPMLPGSIPATGVIHAPSGGIDRLSGEES